ncbi:MAG: hypothetical protein AB9907_06135 [Flexilinea sp.]
MPLFRIGQLEVKGCARGIHGDPAENQQKRQLAIWETTFSAPSLFGGFFPLKEGIGSGSFRSGIIGSGGFFCALISIGRFGGMVVRGAGVRSPIPIGSRAGEGLIFALTRLKFICSIWSFISGCIASHYIFLSGRRVSAALIGQGKNCQMLESVIDQTDQAVLQREAAPAGCG